jgi:hypothetical protein
MPESIANRTSFDDSSEEAFITIIPPNPIIESISPVRPSDRFSIIPDVKSLVIEERSGGNMLTSGAIIAVDLRKSRLFIIVSLSIIFQKKVTNYFFSTAIIHYDISKIRKD